MTGAGVMQETDARLLICHAVSNSRLRVNDNACLVHLTPRDAHSVECLIIWTPYYRQLIVFGEFARKPALAL